MYSKSCPVCIFRYRTAFICFLMSRFREGAARILAVYHIGHNVVVHHEAISDIGFLCVCHLKSQVAVDTQCVVVVLVAGEPDFIKSPLPAQVYKEVESFCCQMPAPITLFYV